jgi:DNA-binding GntR family transcriptional regulator
LTEGSQGFLLFAEGLDEPHSRLPQLANARDGDLFLEAKRERAARRKEALEGLAAKLAARNIDRPGNRERLVSLEETFDRNFDGSPSRYMTYNMAFHRLIIDLADNARLTQLFEQLELPGLLALLHVVVEPPPVAVSRAEHRPIVEAILNGREAGASAAMRAHIGHTARYLSDHAVGTQFKRKPRSKS